MACMCVCVCVRVCVFYRADAVVASPWLQPSCVSVRLKKKKSPGKKRHPPTRRDQLSVCLSMPVSGSTAVCLSTSGSSSLHPKCCLPLSCYIRLSLSLSLSSSVSLSPCFYWSLSLCLSHSASICLSLSRSVSTLLYVRLYMSVFVSMCVSLFLCVSLCFYVCLSAAVSLL